MHTLLRLSRRPDAVFCANDLMAIGALDTARDLGLSIPTDVAIVGFDDVPIASLVRPALTTLRIQIAETGRKALERLVRMVNAAGEAVADTACEVVRPELVVRPSSQPATSDSPKPAGVFAPTPPRYL